MKCAIAASFVMNVPIGHKLAAMCFTVMGAYTIFCGVAGLSLSFTLHDLTGRSGHFPWTVALIGLANCALSFFCAVAAWALFKNTPSAGLIALIVWLLVGAFTLWSMFCLALDGFDIFGVLVVIGLVGLEFVIAIHLIERRHERAAKYEDRLRNGS
jgi:hypothetical protein